MGSPMRATRWHVMSAAQWLSAASCCVAGLTACAGGSPLMHPAQTLSDGHVRFAAGSSANFALGGTSDAIEAAKAEPLGATLDKPSETYTRGALAVAAVSPGMAPFVAGRVGLGYDAEGGLGYTGRTVRIDARYALAGESVALSAGAGGSAILSRRGSSPDAQLGGLNLDATTGWGVDIPILFGWQSSGDIVWWWIGAHGGYEKLRGQVALNRPAPSAALDGDIDAKRMYALGLTGLAVGFRHLHAAIEVQGGYQRAEGTLWDTDVKVEGATVSPAAALIGKF